MSDLVSILLPFYNCVDTLPECLSSIQNQTYPNFEVVGVNDASTDNSQSIFQEFQKRDHRFKLYSFPRNRGIVDALNFGLTQCQGQWIARMDSDDRMLPARIERQYQFLRQNPSIDLLATCVTVFREDDILTPGQIRYQDWSNELQDNTAIQEQIYAESPLMHPTFFAHQQFFKDLNGYQHSPWPEDYDILFRARFLNKTMAKLPEILLEKRDSPTRIVRTDPRCNRHSMFKAKTYFFAKESAWKEKEKLALASGGAAAKMIIKLLRQVGVEVDVLLNNKPPAGKKTLKRVPIVLFDEETCHDYLEQNPSTYFIIGIGNLEAQDQMEDLLKEHHKKAIRDYMRFL